MICSQCGFESSPIKRFCTKCGAKQALECPQCNSAVEDGESFCGQCGWDLSLPHKSPQNDLSFDEKLEQFQCRLPNGMTQKTLALRNRIEGKRKRVTVLLCEVEGFTGLSEELGAEYACSIIDHILEVIMYKIHDYGGTVNGITEHGIMALFGSPIELKGAPLQAIRAAWAIHREITKLNGHAEQDGRMSIEMRIGIHTGTMVIASLGNDLRVELKEMEGALSMSSAMVEMAKPGTTYVTESTFRPAEHGFLFEPLGQKKVGDEVANVFRAIAPEHTKTPSAVIIDHDLSSSAGREQGKETSVGSSGPAKTVRQAAYFDSTPWENSKNIHKDVSHLKRNTLLFVLIFYIILFSFLAWEFTFPYGTLARITNISQNFWMNFILLIFAFLFTTFCVYKFSGFLMRTLSRTGRQRLNLGSILLHDGYITEEELEDSLAEQNRRVGEILVQSGKITPEQLGKALSRQKGSSMKLGDILKDAGQITEADMAWALSKVNRKLGKILREKGLLSEYNLYWLLKRQRYSQDKSTVDTRSKMRI